MHPGLFVIKQQTSVLQDRVIVWHITNVMNGNCAAALLTYVSMMLTGAIQTAIAVVGKSATAAITAMQKLGIVTLQLIVFKENNATSKHTHANERDQGPFLSPFKFQPRFLSNLLSKLLGSFPISLFIFSL